jgi:hypothetical protein
MSYSLNVLASIPLSFDSGSLESSRHGATVMEYWDNGMVKADALVYLTLWLVPVYKKTLHWQLVFRKAHGA